MESNLQKTERLIREINRLHAQYSQDYFETGKVRKINLSHTLKNVPTEHILSYRLNLHEAVNDYLAFADTRGIDFFYRVKTAESIHDKINRYLARGTQYPTNNILNDIFGARLIWPSETVAGILEKLDGWKTEYGLKTGICAMPAAISAYTFISKTAAISTIRGNCRFGMKRCQSQY